MSDSVVYRATNCCGETCYFGVESLARIWAKKGGKVNEVPVCELRVVSPPTTDWRRAYMKEAIEHQAAQQQMQSLQRAVVAATERAEMAERDAERYKELKNRYCGADFDWNEKTVLVFRIPPDARVSTDLDTTIDAMKEELP